jgi:phosphoglycerate transport regulatory protein PgtC
VNQQITQLEGEWNGRARANYEEAVKLAREAAAL